MTRQQQEAALLAIGWEIVTRHSPITGEEVSPLWFAPWSTVPQELESPDQPAWALVLLRTFAWMGFVVAISEVEGDRYLVGLEGIRATPAHSTPVVADTILEALNFMLLVVADDPPPRLS